MAKTKREPTEQERQAQSNSKMRVDIIREVAVKVRDIKAARKELNQDMADCRERLENCGIHKKGFENALKLADLEDEAARNDYLDGFREAFEALAPGGSVDWVKEQIKQEEDARAAETSDEEEEMAGKTVA